MRQRFLAIIHRIPELTRYIQIGLAVIIISFLFPNSSGFNYNFDKNTLWRFDDLVAPFDFAIQKPVTQYENEVREIENTLYPFYTKDSTVALNQKNIFSNELLTKLQDSDVDEEGLAHVRDNPNLYRQIGLDYLNHIYRRGVVKLEDQHSVNPDALVNVVHRPGELSRRTVRSLQTEEMVEKAIVDSLKKETVLERPVFLEEILKNSIVPNIAYNDTLTNLFHKAEIGKVAKSQGKVNEGELIVRRGQNISEDIYQKLLSLQERSENQKDERNKWLVSGGYLLLTILLVGVFVLFFYIFHPTVFGDLRQLSFMLMWLILFSWIVYSVREIGFLNPYLIPFCIVPIVVKNFYNQQIALFTHIVVVMLAGFLANQGYEFLFTEIMAGVVVVLANVRIRDFSSFFYSMIYVLLTYTSVYLALSLIDTGRFDSIDWYPLAWIGFNIILTLLAFPLIPLLERVFGFTSELTLMELGSLDQPLLKELSLKSPGTLQHSLQVSNLAEAAASAIGANALLVKVAAYYHDIGKTKNPFHFIENQGKTSPHDNLTPLQSASIILEHVTEGIRIAKKEGLPKIIIDFIETHHGKTRVEYFYRKHLKENPDEEVDENQFRYQGRLPQTKEETILMVADSIEAASKSLKNPDEAAIDNLVEGIIAGKIKLQQFDDTDLSFRELETIKAVFKKQLKSIYHIRIEYPDGK